MDRFETTTIWRNGDVLRQDSFGRVTVRPDTLTAEQMRDNWQSDSYLAGVRARAELMEEVEL